MDSDSASVGKAVGPSVVGQMLRDRSLRLAAGLAIAVAIPVAVLFYFQFRSISDLSKSSTVVLKQLSEETADGLTRSVEDALKMPYINTLLRTSQNQTEPLNLGVIAPTFEQGLELEPFVDRFYVWSDVGNEHRGDVLAYDRVTHGFHSGTKEASLMVRRFRELSKQKRAISVFEETIDGRRTYFQAQIRFVTPAREQMSSFVALRVDAERLRREYFPAFFSEKLKNVEGPIGFPPLVVTLLDADNRVIVPANGVAPHHFEHETSFPL